MEETSILETFRFDFTYRERDSKQLNNLFKKYGYPNLIVDLSSDYDGYWQVYNTRNQQTIWSDYHSGFVTFFKDNKHIKIAFDHKDGYSLRKLDRDFEFDNSIYFENTCKITKDCTSSEVDLLKEEIKSLKKEIELYKEREQKILKLINPLS